jgi:Spy/CpxP family protein refolding chaperone
VSRARVLGALLLTMTFVVGGLGGMALEEAAGIDWFDFLDEDAPSDDSGGDRAFLMQMDLTSEQRDRIDAIFEQQDDELETYWRSQLPALRAIVRQSDTRIAAVLSAEQRAQFEQRIRDRGSSVPRQSD